MSGFEQYVASVSSLLDRLPKCPRPAKSFPHVHVKNDIKGHFPLLTWFFDNHASIIPSGGTWIEFGVFEGESFRYIAERRGEAKLWGFDSFVGLPEDWTDSARKGTFAVDQMPLPPPGTHYVVGLFSDVLPSFNPPDPVTFCHVDCDLYSSTKTVLEWLRSRVVPGSIILFDDVLWPPLTDHGLRALYEAWPDVGYEWLASGTVQAVLRVTSIPNANGEGGQ